MLLQWAMRPCPVGLLPCVFYSRPFGKGEMNLQRRAVLFGLHSRVYLLVARSVALEQRASSVVAQSEELKCCPFGRDDMNLQR